MGINKGDNKVDLTPLPMTPLPENKSDTFYDMTIKRQVEQIVRLSFYLCEVYLESHE